ncbi:acyltransferase [Flavobacterium luteum]|uniref:Acyltransferase family protein n=1 Tax=Flavobacterium luteum TaxID=2026654 RepID=A0A7J5AE68_9FLAO|nr:acyltransferase [Flavobacterium luteum]KAB1155864.1 acyltransferase family protein [Flavobacterium luteum]
MNEIKKRYDFIDLLKAIAIFFVVMFHFNYLQIDFLIGNDNISYINYFIKSILCTCVPLFFFVNGALLLNKSSLDLKNHIFKMGNIIILTVVWGIITLLALSIIRNEKLSFLEVIKGVYYLKDGWINHIWFLEALICIYIFFPLIFHVFKNNVNSFYFFFACVMLLTFGNSFISNCATVISFLSQKMLDSQLTQNHFKEFNPFRGMHGYSIGYFLLGGLLFYHKDFINRKKYRLIAIITIPLSMLLLFLYGVIVSKKQNQIWNIVWYGYDTIFALILVAAIFVLSLKYQHKGIFGKGIHLIGENSLGIYFLHIIIGDFLKPFYSEIEFNQTIVVNIIFASIILLSSLFIVLLFKKIPIVKHLFIIN